MADRTLRVAFVGDTSDLERAFKRAGKAGTSSLKTLSKVGLAAGAAIGGGLAVEVVRATKAFEESEKVTKQSEAVIKSTGGAAKITAKQVASLSTALSNKTGIDDEVIQRGENMLLTFTNIRNEAGKGNDVFNQATKTLTDMSTALGEDASKGAIQLGKALNDPIKGVSALRKVGVTFTEQQQQQIKTLVESGKTMDAQKLIIAELNKEFGGSAEAQARPLDKLKVAVGNLEESLGGALAPALSKAATTLSTFIAQMQAGTGAGGRFVAAMRSAFETVRGVVQTSITAIRGFLQRNQEDIRAVGQAFQNVAHVIAVIFDGFVLPTLRRALPGITKLLQGFAEQIRGIVRIISGILTLDFGKAWDGVKDVFGGAIKTTLGLMRAMTAPFREAASQLGHSILSGIRNGLHSLGDLPAFMFRLGWGLAKSLITGVMHALASLPGRILGLIKSIHLPKTILGVHIPGQAAGGKTSGPQLAMIGEGRGPEYVIPTEPRYRGRATDLLEQAAGDLGIPGYAFGFSPRRFGLHAHAHANAQHTRPLIGSRLRKAARADRAKGKRTGIPADIEAVPADVVAIEDNTAAIEDNTSTNQAQTDALQALADAEKRRADIAERALAVSQTETGSLKGFIADIISGEIGGRVGLGYQTPSFAGGGVRY